MNPLFILAEAAETTTTSDSEIVPIDLIWEQITSIGLLESLMFLSFGVVCLLYGWRVFKILVVISFALAGLVGGAAIAKSAGLNADYQILAAVGAAGLVGFISIPLMRYAVSILGAVAGGILTAGIWYALHLPELYIWAGALIGIIAGGMISFIIFKISVMLFSCLGGSALMITGLLALLYQYEPTTENVKSLVMTEKWFLPIILLIPTIVGVYLQNKYIKGESEWEI